MLLLTVFGSVLLSFIWFAIVIYICKHRYGKEASFPRIMTCLILAGPMGWVTIVIIAAYDLVDKIYDRYHSESEEAEQDEQ